MQTMAVVKKRFDAKVVQPHLFLQDENINGFSHPNIPIITNKNANLIETEYTWGLMPSWAKEISFRKNTLNAKIETLTDKPSFKNSVENRCLIIATAFYEWHWLDKKGKQKQKYQINGETEIITFAGIYNHWTNPATGEVLKTYSMLTTTANVTMQFVHNHKKRMPIVLKQEGEIEWLNGKIALHEIAYPYESRLIAFPV
jgi:putative SOS response-associated peptidase YedK